MKVARKKKEKRGGGRGAGWSRQASEGKADGQGWPPHWWEVESTVHIYGGTPPSNGAVFCSFPFPVVRKHLLDLSTFPINGVVTLLHT